MKSRTRTLHGLKLIADPQPGMKTWWHTEDQEYWVIRAVTRDPWKIYWRNPLTSGSKLVYCGFRTMKDAAKKLKEYLSDTEWMNDKTQWQSEEEAYKPEN